MAAAPGHHLNMSPAPAARIGAGLPAIAAAATAATTTAAAATAATTAVVAATAAAAVVTAATAVATAAVAAAATAVATAAAAVAATAAAATAEAAAAAAEAAAAAAAAALLALLGLVDAERAAIQRAAVHALDGLGGLFGRAHGHERKPTRAAGFTVLHQVDVADRAELLKRGAYAVGGGVEGKVSNVQTSVHLFVLDLAQQTQGQTRPPRGPWCSEAGFKPSGTGTGSSH